MGEGNFGGAGSKTKPALKKDIKKQAGGKKAPAEKKRWHTNS